MDLYETLEVERTATPTEIKKAFRYLSKKYHPDTCVNAAGKKEREDVQVKLNQAYSILSDPKKRAFYDEHGVSTTEQQTGTKASSLVMEIFMNILSQDFDKETLFIVAHSKLDSMVENIKAQQTQGEERIDFLSTVLAQKVKTSRTHLDRAISATIQGIKSTLGNIALDKLAAEEAQAILKEHYEREPEPEREEMKAYDYFAGNLFEGVRRNVPTEFRHIFRGNP